MTPDEAQDTWNTIRVFQDEKELTQEEGVEQVRQYSPPLDEESWVLLVRRNGGIIQVGPVALPYDDLRSKLGLPVTNEEGEELHVRQ